MAASSFIPAPYDRYAEAYRDWWAPILAPAATRLLDRLDEVAKSDAPLHLLDVGTGTGTLALAALRRWPHVTVTAIDPSSVILRLAEGEARRQDTADRLRALPGEADRLPLADHSVDHAFSSFVIQLVASRAAALRETVRVLRPGGLFACLTWQAWGDPFEPDEIVDRVFEELDVEVPIGGQTRPYTSATAAAAELRRAGLREVRARTEWLEHRYSVQSYLAVLENWIEDEVFMRLEPGRRERLLGRLGDELARLRPEALVWRRPLVSVIGRRPRQAGRQRTC